MKKSTLSHIVPWSEMSEIPFPTLGLHGVTLSLTKGRKKKNTPPTKERNYIGCGVTKPRIVISSYTKWSRLGDSSNWLY